jgi:cytochrome oxidase assembly protein ShyY1
VYGFLARPRWIGATLVTLLAVAAFTGLGSWQWHRAKTRDTPHAAELSQAPPIPVSQALGTSDSLRPGTSVRNVTAIGHYDGAHQVLTPGRALDGRDGTYVLTPLLGVDGLGAKGLIVLRGWVPGTPTVPPEAPAGTVRTTGWLSPSEDADTPVAADLPAVLPAGQVATVTTARVLSLVPYRLVDAYVGLQTQTPASTLKAVPAPPAPKPGIHWSVQSLSYAIEWWFFALAAVWMLVTAARRERRSLPARPGPPGARPRTSRTG